MECSNCGYKFEPEPHEGEVTIEWKGTEITVKGQISKCPNCKNEFADSDAMRDIAKKLDEKIDKLKTPDAEAKQIIKDIKNNLPDDLLVCHRCGKPFVPGYDSIAGRVTGHIWVPDCNCCPEGYAILVG